MKMNLRTENPNDDFVLTSLKVEYERMATIRAMASSHLVNLRTAIISAERAVSLANSHLEQSREYIAERMHELGIEVPEQYHARDCECEACAPLDGDRWTG